MSAWLTPVCRPISPISTLIESIRGGYPIIGKRVENVAGKGSGRIAPKVHIRGCVACLSVLAAQATKAEP
jgi:hypothetical protein